jgi:hypothetical protein
MQTEQWACQAQDVPVPPGVTRLWVEGTTYQLTDLLGVVQGVAEVGFVFGVGLYRVRVCERGSTLAIERLGEFLFEELARAEASIRGPGLYHYRSGCDEPLLSWAQKE